MNWLLIVIGWVVCGILSYGIVKNTWRQLYVEDWPALCPDTSADILFIAYGLLGPWGLIAAYIITIFFSKKKIGLCYIMPKKLYSPRS